jgi:hypothetical protein
MNAKRHFKRAKAGQGAVAITFAIALPVLLGMIALAIDLGQLYFRQTQLQQAADNLALAVARRLNGTKAGLDSALADANTQGVRSVYGFKGDNLFWNQSALQLTSSLDQDPIQWKDASSISSDTDATGLVYAKIDISKLTGTGDDPGLLGGFLVKIFDQSGASGVIRTVATAIAGPATVQVTPLAICALDPGTAAGTFTHTAVVNEKLEYGFRRGVSYNLLDLSPNSTTPQNFLVNPVDPGAGSDNAAHFGASFVKPFFCSGTVALPGLHSNSKIHIQPLTLDLTDWLNSRFNDYPASTGCTRSAAMPDQDVREYIGGYTNWYMSTTPGRTATSVNRNSNASRVTYADLAATDTVGTAPTISDFGPLWVYSRALKTNNTTYALTDWSNLYSYAGVTVPTPNTTKYGSAASGVVYNASTHRVFISDGVQNRRVLNVPLLNCSAGTPSNPATVLAIGRFFMPAKARPAAGTVPAIVPGEFAGLLATESPVAHAALYK